MTDSDEVVVAPTETGTVVIVWVPVTMTLLDALGRVVVAVCGWQTSLVQVTVSVTTMVLVSVYEEVIVLLPEVKVVVPTGQVVVV